MKIKFNFEAYEKSGKNKREALDYLKGLKSDVDFQKLEAEYKTDEAIFNALKNANFTYEKINSISKQKDDNYPKKEAAQNQHDEAFLQKKERFKKQVENANFIDRLSDDIIQGTGLNYALDLGNTLLSKIGLGNKDYISTSERERIERELSKEARDKIAKGAKKEDLNEAELFSLKNLNDTLTQTQAYEKEKEKARLIKQKKYNKSDVDLMEKDLGFFQTLFNDDKDSIKEFKDKYKSETIISSDIQKAINSVKQFSSGELLLNAFNDDKDKKEAFTQELLSDAYKIAELNGFDDVGLDKSNQLYFIKKDDKGVEHKYAVNTGFIDNFYNTLSNAKLEIAGGVGASIAAAKKAKGTPFAKAAKIIGAGAAGSYAGGFSDALLNDIYLNRETNFKRNLDYALQAGLLSAVGDGVIISTPLLYKNAIKPVYEKAKKLADSTILGTLKTVPTQNIEAAEKIINETFTDEMKKDFQKAKDLYGGVVKAGELENGLIKGLKSVFINKYGENDAKVKAISKVEEIINTNSLKKKQHEILELIRSDEGGGTLAYLLEVAKDDPKIQNNLKLMLNRSTRALEDNLNNLQIDYKDIKKILDDFEKGHKEAFKSVEDEIAKIYDDKTKIIIDDKAFKTFENELIENGVAKEESLNFLNDLKNNVFNPNGVTFTQLNNFRKNLNYYIFNKDKSPNFVNSVKKIVETSLKAEIDKGITSLFNQKPETAKVISQLYTQSLKDYTQMKELNESIKRLKLQDKEKEAESVVDSLIKYAKGQGEGGVNNLNQLKNYLGDKNNAFLEMQILHRLFKKSVMESEQGKLKTFNSDEFLKNVKDLIKTDEQKTNIKPDDDTLLNFHTAKIKEVKAELSRLLKPIFKENLRSKDGVEAYLSLNSLSKMTSDKAIQRSVNNGFSRGEHLEAIKDIKNIFQNSTKINEEAHKSGDKNIIIHRMHGTFKEANALLTLKESLDKDKKRIYSLELELIPRFNDKIRPTDIKSNEGGFNSQKARGGLSSASIVKPDDDIIPQPFFKSKEARDFLDLVEGFHKLYKNDINIAKNLSYSTSEKLGTALATTAEGAIKQKIVRGVFDPIFRLLPDGIFFNLFSKQIQGAALRYHLKKALSRSLDYDDFKIKLTDQLKKGTFTSKTKIFLDEFLKNVENLKEN